MHASVCYMHQAKFPRSTQIIRSLQAGCADFLVGSQLCWTVHILGYGKFCLSVQPLSVSPCSPDGRRPTPPDTPVLLTTRCASAVHVGSASAYTDSLIMRAVCATGTYVVTFLATLIDWFPWRSSGIGKPGAREVWRRCCATRVWGSMSMQEAERMYALHARGTGSVQLGHGDDRARRRRSARERCARGALGACTWGWLLGIEITAKSWRRQSAYMRHSPEALV